MIELLDTKKNTIPRPVLSLWDLADNALAVGACACNRCRRADGDQTGYLALHTAVVKGRAYSRLFTRTTVEEARLTFVCAWEAQYLTKLKNLEAIDLEAVSRLGSGEVSDRLIALVVVMGIVQEGESGHWVFRS